MINKLNLYFDYLVQTGLNKSLISSIIGHKITGSNSFKLPWIQEINPQIIIDIGANTGQTATEMRKIFPKASIYSFEPIPTCFEKLNQSMKGDKKFHSYCVGLGDKTSTAEFNVNDFNPSSSLLETSDIGKKIYPHISKTTTNTIQIKKLDDYKILNNQSKPSLIKIDVQGFEDKVIKGGLKTIANATIVIIETSFQKIYKDQPLFGDIYEAMIKIGFEFKGFSETYIHSQNGQTLFTDSIFISSGQQKQPNHQQN